MKLSTRSRYGTRMMLDLAEHYEEGPVRIGGISKRQDISVKYLEQLIIPLKRENLIKSVRGPKGGHMLAKRPEEVTVGEVVKALEGGIDLANCVGNPHECERSGACPTRSVWEEATKAMYDKLNSVTLKEMMKKKQGVEEFQGG